MVIQLLVVDDDPDILALMQMDFELMGFDVTTAINGQEAFKQLEGTAPFDVVLLDVMMPKMDGYELCKRMRTLPHREETPVILLTAKGQLEDKVKGFHAGADDYLVKPFEFQELMVRMRALLRRTGKLAQLKQGAVATKAVESTKISPVDENLGFGALRLLPKSLEVLVFDELKRLTPTEFEILYCLMQHVNEPVPLGVLLKEVWGYDADEDVRMLRVHVGGLRQKIEPNPKQPTFVQTVSHVGYKLVLAKAMEKPTDA
jgi:DNA-binding response OmpR family regulator